MKLGQLNMAGFEFFFNLIIVEDYIKQIPSSPNFVFVYGHTWPCSRLAMHLESLLCSENYMVCRGSNPCQLLASQVSYLSSCCLCAPRKFPFRYNAVFSKYRNYVVVIPNKGYFNNVLLVWSNTCLLNGK